MFEYWFNLHGEHLDGIPEKLWLNPKWKSEIEVTNYAGFLENVADQVYTA